MFEISALVAFALSASPASVRIYQGPLPYVRLLFLTGKLNGDCIC